jgi:cytochrome c biogenesis protein ResB
MMFANLLFWAFLDVRIIWFCLMILVLIVVLFLCIINHHYGALEHVKETQVEVENETKDFRPINLIHFCKAINKGHGNLTIDPH